jgi:hypothetical protein
VMLGVAECLDRPTINGPHVPGQHPAYG